MKFALLFCLFVACVIGQAPPTSTWDTAFSASVLITSTNATYPPVFMRWFYDNTNNRERFDGMREMFGQAVFTETFFFGNSGGSPGGQFYSISYIDNQVFCRSTTSSDYTLPDPNFSGFKYFGPSVINYEAVYGWFSPNSQPGDVGVYFNDQTTFEPVMFQRLQNDATTTVSFMEYDAGSQDPSLFIINPLIIQNCVSA